MVHLRIVAPAVCAHQVMELLCAWPSVLNVVHLPGAALKPEGDVILCDVAREDASLIIADLKELDLPAIGSIAVGYIDTAIGEVYDAAERAAPGLASDAVVWEDVAQHTSENTELSVSFVAFMVLAMQLAAVGILIDQPILIVGAMVVGPEFGPLAGISVALVERQGGLARRSLTALILGFPVGIALALVATVIFKETGVAPGSFTPDDHPLTDFISHPDFFSFFVAYIAGTAGVLSLTSAKSGALIGVLISVTTIPAASNVGVAAAYGDWSEASGAAAQLAINLAASVLAGVVTLVVQRRSYVARRHRHLSDPARTAAGLPLGHSRQAEKLGARPER
ncbi:MAG TPA: DUF389 domain-containing protein [Thermoleophilaceae bacterium]|nr:DUF389 domain-containing protein [Thermoleophilaceae bacterium]